MSDNMTRDEVLANWREHSHVFTTVNHVDYMLNTDPKHGGWFFLAIFPNKKLIVSPIYTGGDMTPGLYWSGGYEQAEPFVAGETPTMTIAKPLAQLFEAEAYS